MVPFQLALTLLILSVCAFAPGFFFVRRLRWSPLEVLCGSVALSLLILWLSVWALYVFVPGAWTAGSFAITLVSAGLGVLAWHDVRKLFRAARVRSVVGAWGFLLLWTLLILAAVRHFSGGTWFGDWLEHFQRTLVYLYHMPAGTEIFGGYRIPSRPPLAHVITAFVMAQTADRFEIYQLVFAFLTLLMFLPCCLMLPLVSRPWKFGVLPLDLPVCVEPRDHGQRHLPRHQANHSVLRRDGRGVLPSRLEEERSRPHESRLRRGGMRCAGALFRHTVCPLPAASTTCSSSSRTVRNAERNSRPSLRPPVSPCLPGSAGASRGFGARGRLPLSPRHR